MKKIILILALLVLTASPAQAANAPQASFFASTDTHEVGLPLPYKHEVVLNAEMFDTASVGIYAIQDDYFVAPTYRGIVKVTGSCYQFNPDGLIRIYAYSSDGKFLVANGIGKFFSFTFVTDSQWIQFGASSGTQIGYNLLKCSLLFEAVQ